jgi:hypothetical protein
LRVVPHSPPQGEATLNPNRIKIVEATPEFFTIIFSLGMVRARVVADGIPSDAVFRGCYHFNGMIRFVYQHESFDEIPVGVDVPKIHPKYKTED